MHVDVLARNAGRVVTAAELGAHGIDRNAVASLRRAGRLVRMFHGTYAVPPVEDGDFALACRAAVRYAGAGACLLGESALAFATPYPEPAAPEVGVPRARAVRATPGLRVAHCTDATLAASVLVGGVRVQRAPYAVAWAWSRTRTLDDRRAILCAATGCRAVAAADVRDSLARLPRMRGRSALAEACDHVEAGCRSPAEIEYLVRVERAYGLPSGERQARIDVPGGRCRYVDVQYGRVVVEVDGEHHRLDQDTRADDAVRDVVLAALGLHVLHVRARDVRTNPGLVAGIVRDALARA